MIENKNQATPDQYAYFHGDDKLAVLFAHLTHTPYICRWVDCHTKETYIRIFTPNYIMDDRFLKKLLQLKVNNLHKIFERAQSTDLHILGLESTLTVVDGVQVATNEYLKHAQDAKEIASQRDYTKEDYELYNNSVNLYIQFEALMVERLNYEATIDPIHTNLNKIDKKIKKASPYNLAWYAQVLLLVKNVVDMLTKGHGFIRYSSLINTYNNYDNLYTLIYPKAGQTPPERIKLTNIVSPTNILTKLRDKIRDNIEEVYKLPSSRRPRNITKSTNIIATKLLDLISYIPQL